MNYGEGEEELQRAKSERDQLKTENLRLKLLVAAFTVVNDCETDPLVRVIEAAHKHGAVNP